MYKAVLLSEVDNGWGYEVDVKDKDGNHVAHDDVGYFDLQDYLDDLCGTDNYKIVNTTALSL